MEDKGDVLMKYNKKVKQLVCILCDLGEEVTVISRQTQIPKSTIYYWLKSYRDSKPIKEEKSKSALKSITIKIDFK